MLTGNNSLQIVQDINALDVGGDHVHRVSAGCIAVQFELSTGQKFVIRTIGLGDTQCVNGQVGGRSAGRGNDGFVLPGQVGGVEQVGAGFNISAGFYRSFVLDDNFCGRSVDGLCVITISPIT